MHRKILAACCFLLLGSLPAFSQVLNPVTPLDGGSPVSASNPLHVTGSFSATLSGFTPTPAYATLTATNASASVALPAGTVVAFQNTGTTTVSCTLGIGSATATASQVQVPASSTVFLTVGSNTFGACIDQTGSTSNLVVLAGGSGLGTGFGGGGGGSGGGGAITAASGSYASGALSVGAGTDGWDATQGAKADSVCGTATGTCSIAALIKFLNSTASGATPAGTNLIGNMGQLYPAGSTPITASATGTTAATTATLAANATLHTYICGFSIRANATAAATNNATVTGTITGTLNFTQWTAPLASGLGVTEEVFSPCVISSAVNTGIAVVSGAPGSGGVVSVSAWGYQL